MHIVRAQRPGHIRRLTLSRESMKTERDSMHRYTLAMLWLAACGNSMDAAALRTEAQQHYSQLPSEYTVMGVPSTEAAVTLGRMLYYDTRLSKNHDLSCNSCHALTQYGVDGRPFSLGHKNQLGGRNAPTVYNAAGALAQFWDGRAANVEAQALGPIRNPVEMAMPSDQAVIDTVGSMTDYVQAFDRAFPGQPITMAHIGDAIGAFERRLVTPGRWDRFLNGEADALTDAELGGLQTFLDVGCASCHDGPLLGGTSYRRAGALRPWPNGDQDLGRFAVTKDNSDRGFFKVPTLRNVARTAPYFHDSSAATLPDAVQRMASVELARDLSADQTASIVTFLEALTGELPTDYIKMPTLPQSSATTPLPDPT